MSVRSREFLYCNYPVVAIPSDPLARNLVDRNVFPCSCSRVFDFFRSDTWYMSFSTLPSDDKNVNIGISYNI